MAELIAESLLRSFVAESNRIEGIHREPIALELSTTADFLTLERPTVDSLVALVGVYQPDARLRDRPDVPGVRVGRHVAPPSGSHISGMVQEILFCAQQPETRSLSWRRSQKCSVFMLHREYEHLHPFTDGNGRSGRALWLWMVLRDPAWLPVLEHYGSFLHVWYYQSLDAGDGR